MNRRKIKRYRNSRRNSGMKFAGIIGIMIAAVICGYLTARFVIAPLLGYDTEVLKLDFPSKMTALIDTWENSGNDKENEEQADEESVTEEKKPEKEETSEKPEEETGYALQFGVFTTKSRAEELKSKLSADGITSQIKESENKYKVISSLFDTKEDAVKQLKETKTGLVSDIFIAVIK